LFRDLNDLGISIGIDIEGEQIGILLYADDIVLIAENENDLTKTHKTPDSSVLHSIYA
jgi:hypothetical protein